LNYLRIGGNFTAHLIFRTHFGKAFVQADRPATIANYFIDLDDATINPRDVVATINAR
jgi:hypothetical protein